ncbi:hypothetical protein BJ944DRAFT_269162 [Cunninghamella echinulata]|nr:hypothetical protein BJ944DRAFT_269162 [Cunninghamella echinulata]
MKPGSMSSFKKGTRSNSSSSITIKNNDNNNNNNVVPMNTKSTSSISSRNSTNNKETTGNNKSRLRKPTITTAGNNTTSSSTSSSFCHVPSTTSSTTSLKKEEINNTTNTSSLPPPVPTIPDNITDKDQLIRQLQEELQTQLSINRVLQGQKEAITRDLDYFSLTVDELMEEKESLVQKYEEEKINNLTKEEDLNVLLAKLKETTDHARERSAEVDQWKAEIEKTKEEAALELEEVKSVLQRKNQEITQLKGQLDNANDTIESLSSQVKNLSSQVDQLLEQINTHQHQSSSIASQHSAAIETPNPSPQLQAQKYSHDDQDDNNQHQEFVTPLSSFKSSHSNNGFGFSNQQYRNSPPSLTVVTTTNDLDDQLLTLTKTKEKLQSDYSKIPLSGGGPMSRRRKEELEDMLDEVDQQLSRVKQKIRRS